MGDFRLGVDFSNVAPEMGGNMRFLPVSDQKGWLVHIVDGDERQTQDKKGVLWWLSLVCIDGNARGQAHDWFINKTNDNADAQRIGRGQMSAVAHAIGHLQVGNGSELFNRPFRVVVAPDTRNERNPNATRIVDVLTANGDPVVGGKTGGQQSMQSTSQNSFGGGNNTPGQNNNGFGGAGPGSTGQNNGGAFGQNGSNGGGFDPNTGQRLDNGQNNGNGGQNNGGAFGQNGGGTSFGGFN